MIMMIIAVIMLMADFMITIIMFFSPSNTPLIS